MSDYERTDEKVNTRCPFHNGWTQSDRASPPVGALSGIAATFDLLHSIAAQQVVTNSGKEHWRPGHVL